MTNLIIYLILIVGAFFLAFQEYLEKLEELNALELATGAVSITT